MKRLHKLLLKEYFKPLVATFFVALFILILQFLWKHIDKLAGKGLDGGIIAELLLYSSATLVPLALPLAVLLSSIMTFGNLGENLELTAIKSSGISLQEFMRPLIVLIAALSIAAFFYANHVIPYANLKAGSLLYDIKKQREELQIREGVFYNDIEGYSIKVGQKNPRTKLLKEIMIYRHDDKKGNAEVTVADSGYIKMTSDETKLLVTLYHGQTYIEMEESKDARAKRKAREYPHQVRKFDKETMLMDISGFNFTRTDVQLFKDSYQMLKLSQLEEKKDSIQQIYNQKARELSNRLQKNMARNQPAPKRPQKQASDGGKRDIKKMDAPPHSPHSTVEKKAKAQAAVSTQAGRGAGNQEKTTDEPPRKEEAFNLKRWYNTLPNQAKENILRNALSQARNNSKSISNSRRIFEHRQKNIYKHEIYWHEKITLSFACLIFFFIGAPLGSIIRKGGLGTPLVISVVMFIIYYIISMTGENFVEKGVLPAEVGMWVSSLLFLPMGIFLTYKATNDSMILSTETYVRMIRKILGMRSKKRKAREGEQL